ncbi:hypothetical protein [Sinomonas sp. G460-2]|uniref:hypothetical protein n=1 Tax=Sinomonas sp. G460-2 TaxID=3393464 RepID=UPI0039F04E15
MTKNLRWIQLLCFIVTILLTVTGCPAPGPPSASPTPSFTMPPDAVPDSQLLPQVASATPWTDEEAAEISVSWAAPLVSASRPSTADGMSNWLKLLQSIGVTVFDPFLGNKIVLAPKQSSHRMWLYAGQALGLQSVLSREDTSSLDGLLKSVAQATESGGVTEADWKNYLASSLSSPTTPSEHAWGAAMDAAAPRGSPPLTQTLVSDSDYQLSSVQFTLLLIRLMGDSWDALTWIEGTGHQSAGAQTGPTTALPIALSKPRVRPASDSTPVCNVPIPDWVTSSGLTAMSLFLTMVAAGIVASKAETFTAKASPWLAVLGTAMTVLNFLSTYSSFKASIAPTPAPKIVRTKLTSEDQSTAGLTATFGLGEVKGEWLNCLRHVLALTSVDVGMPKPGPWGGAEVSWAVEGGPLVFPGNPSTPSRGDVTHPDGSSSITIAGARQNTDKTQATVSVKRTGTVKATINANTLGDPIDRAMNWVANSIELVLGIAGSETPLGWLPIADVAIKTAMLVANSYMFNTKAAIPITDWSNALTLDYTVDIEVNQPPLADTMTDACGAQIAQTTTEKKGSFVLTSSTPLSPDNGSSYSGHGGLAWGPSSWLSTDQHATLAAPCAGGGVCDPQSGGCCQPAANFTTTETFESGIPGDFDVSLTGYPDKPILVFNLARPDGVDLLPGEMENMSSTDGCTAPFESQTSHIGEGLEKNYSPSDRHVPQGPTAFGIAGFTLDSSGVWRSDFTGVSADGVWSIHETATLRNTP